MHKVKLIPVLLASFIVCLQLSAKKGNTMERDFSGYLFTYFTGAEEAVKYAISLDGYNYFALNDGKPVIESREISSTGGVRDPHILRSEDGKTFYMVATDMKASKGWESNRAIILLKSGDLIHWTSSSINMQETYPGNEDLKSAWAPQTIFDKEAGKYMVYWSMKHGSGTDTIYYAYANKDFTALEDVPKVLFAPRSGLFCIDADIIFKDGLYYMYYKTGSLGGGIIKLATTKSLTSGTWEEKEKMIQLTSEPVEGSSIFKVLNTDTYILAYDVYKKREFHFTQSTDLENFTSISHKVSMDFKPRHGSIIPVTVQELKKLIIQWGKPEGLSEIDRASF